MTDTELRTPATPTAAQSAALLEAVLWELESLAIEGALLATPDLRSATSKLLNTDPGLALTREALADGIAIARLRDATQRPAEFSEITTFDGGFSVVRASIAYTDHHGHGPTLTVAVAAALDER